MDEHIEYGAEIYPADKPLSVWWFWSATLVFTAGIGLFVYADFWRMWFVSASLPTPVDWLLGPGLLVVLAVAVGLFRLICKANKHRVDLFERVFSVVGVVSLALLLALTILQPWRVQVMEFGDPSELLRARFIAARYWALFLWVTATLLEVRATERSVPNSLLRFAPAAGVTAILHGVIHA